MPRKIYNLIGKHFGHLTVIAQADKPYKSTQKFWLCKCDCGKSTIVTTGNLNSGHTISCGHYRRERMKEYSALHRQKIHLGQLEGKTPSNNKTGFRNITIYFYKGEKRFRANVAYNRKRHAATADNLRDALAKREELRAKYWPDYKAQPIDEILKNEGK